jgi:hypothetical protein
MMGTRRMTSFSIQPWPTDTRVGLSQMFISVPTTIWLLTVICSGEPTHSRHSLRTAIGGGGGRAAGGAAAGHHTDGRQQWHKLHARHQALSSVAVWRVQSQQLLTQAA